MSAYVRLLKKSVLTPVKEFHRDWIDELAKESEDKQARNKSVLLSCPFMWDATRRYGPDLGCIFPLQIIQVRTFFHKCLAALAWFDSICSQVDRQDKASWEGIIYLDPVSEDSFSPRCLGRLSQMQ